MISITIDDKQVKAMLKAMPKQAGRAAEQALDFTAVRIADEERTQMLRRFDNPTQYTLNSLKVTKTKGHNMTAIVGFKEPERMGQHYLLPQVEGGERKLKGFERALGNYEFIPSKHLKLNAQGNITHATAKNAIASKGTNKGGYVYLSKLKGNALPPGVYQRFKTDRAAITPQGLKPILLQGRTGHAVRPLLPFYEIAHTAFDRYFTAKFTAEFNRMMGR